MNPEQARGALFAICPICPEPVQKVRSFLWFARHIGRWQYSDIRQFHFSSNMPSYRWGDNLKETMWRACRDAIDEYTFDWKVAMALRRQAGGLLKKAFGLSLKMSAPPFSVAGMTNAIITENQLKEDLLSLKAHVQYLSTNYFHRCRVVSRWMEELPAPYEQDLLWLYWRCRWVKGMVANQLREDLKTAAGHTDIDPLG